MKRFHGPGRPGENKKVRPLQPQNLKQISSMIPKTSGFHRFQRLEAEAGTRFRGCAYGKSGMQCGKAEMRGK